MSAHRHLTWGDGRLRVASWRGDETTAYLVPDRGRPTREGIERSMQELSTQGYSAAVTAALSPADQAPFLEVGFAVHERLHLLTRPVDLPMPELGSRITLRRGRRSDRQTILAVDGAAFSPFWHLDGSGLDDAMAATPAARLRIAERPDDGSVAGYAITGRAGARGYLQRLAVDPGLQRGGIGSALVGDGVRWLKRWGAREVLVNTQEENTSALALYEALGFRRQPGGLAVLRRDVDGPPP
ncbi:MAG: GNAT family N-acetyltransferase [Acidimicrobiales bacterium]